MRRMAAARARPGRSNVVMAGAPEKIMPSVGSTWLCPAPGAHRLETLPLSEWLFIGGESGR